MPTEGRKAKARARKAAREREGMTTARQAAALSSRRTSREGGGARFVLPSYRIDFPFRSVCCVQWVSQSTEGTEVEGIKVASLNYFIKTLGFFGPLPFVIIQN